MAAATTTAVAPVDLAALCNQDDPREHLRTPWAVPGGAAATNGIYLVFLAGADAPEFSGPGDTETYTRELIDQARMAAAVQTLTWTRLETVFIPDAPACGDCAGSGKVRVTECYDCDGNGEFSHGFHEYVCQECHGIGTVPASGGPESPCERCDGDGRRWDHVPVRPPGTPRKWGANAKYVLRLRSHLPDAEIAFMAGRDMFAIRFPGGLGLLMPLRMPPAYGGYS